MKSNHIVFTTINKPIVLHSLHENLQKYNHLSSTMCWVVGDKKTIKECPELCRQIDEMGLETRYIDIDQQDSWGKRFPEFYSLIPYNNETRRNIGYLYALEHGCERLISIDDDNFPTNQDFIGLHSITGKIHDQEVLEEPSGFHNICEYLEFEPNRPIYPRGYPFNLRNSYNSPNYINKDQDIIIGVNTGLWLKEPDIDAITWLNGKTYSKSYNISSNKVLNQNTWIPINTQNTSVLRELIPFFFCIPMGYPIPGGTIQRYGDIWAGYFLQALIQNSPYHIEFGLPIVEHRRNDHNYIDDLRYEYWGMILTDWLLNLLKNDFSPTSDNLIDRLNELSIFLRESIEEIPSWCPSEIREFISQTSVSIDKWVGVCKDLI